MKITWYGHSCFKAQTKDGSVLFDPYETGRVPGYAPLPASLSADRVICSHEHRDHNAVGLVALTGRDFGGKITQVATWHDDAMGEKRGKNMITVIESNGEKLVHMGDIGCGLDNAQAALLKNADVLLIPVGGYYTIDAREAREMADMLAARVVIPMHFRTESFGYKEIGALDSFLRLCSNTVSYNTNTIEVTEQTAFQTAVLKYLP